MEMTNEKLYKASSNIKLDKLILKRERLGNRLIRFIKLNKFITVVWVAFIMFSILNFYMIYTFMRILQWL